MYTLSIVIPVYNVEKYINKCLDSIIPQLTDEVEVVLVDDGSSDDSGNICEFYSNQFENVYLYRKENGGLSDARNYGFSLAKGEYVWYIDSDDYISEECVCDIINLLNAVKPDVFIICSKCDEDGNVYNEREYSIPTGEYSSHEFMLQIKKHPRSIYFCAQYSICKREYIMSNGVSFLKGIIHEDELWTPYIFMNASKIYYSGLIIYYHVIREGSIMTSRDYIKSGKSDMIISETLFKYFDDSERNDLHYMRDNAVNIYLQGVWKIPDFLETPLTVKKRCLIRNSYYFKTIFKTLVFCFSPKFYVFLHSLIRK